MHVAYVCVCVYCMKSEPQRPHSAPAWNIFRNHYREWPICECIGDSVVRILRKTDRRSRISGEIESTFHPIGIHTHSHTFAAVDAGVNEQLIAFSFQRIRFFPLFAAFV